MDINSDNKASCYRNLVPIALGKYLFSFRTQKSSPVAPIILLLRETRKVPNYGKTTLHGVVFLVNGGEVLTFWHKCDIMKVYPDAAKNISKGE